MVDAVTQSLLPKKKKVVDGTTPNMSVAPTQSLPSPPQKPSQPQVIRDAETGKITFIDLPSGQVLHGSDKELRTILDKKNAIAQTPAGSVEASQVARQNQIQGLINNPQEQPQGVTQDPTGNNINLPAPVEAGLGKLAAPAIGATIGGVLGAAGGPVGVAAGASTGAFLAEKFVSGLTAKLKQEQEQKIRVSFDSVGKSQAKINKLITYTRRGGDPVLAWESVNKELASIDQAESEIKLTSQEDLSTFLSVDGGDQLGSIRNWNEQIRPNIELLFLQAAQNPSGANDPTDLLDLTDFGTS